tara:strand:- start:277 stop:474 length:198 start_codon:yes stop_codon:yes gene_type:complete
VIKVGYKTIDNADVTYQECINTGEANTVIDELRNSKIGDSSIRYFYLEAQTTNTEWEKYAFIDQL